MEMIVKIGLLSAAALVICGFMRECLPQLSAAFTMAAVLLVACVAFPVVQGILSSINELTAANELSPLVTPVLKVLVITSVSKLLSQMCADSGEKALGSVVELFGGICGISVIIPLLLSALKGMGSII